MVCILSACVHTNHLFSFSKSALICASPQQLNIEFGQILISHLSVIHFSVFSVACEDPTGDIRLVCSESQSSRSI